MPDIIEFDRPKITPSIIMVTGVGGGGSNAVNHMYDLGIADVSFMVCNTDRQALYRSPVPIKVRLGEKLTEGLGAGNNPERGREAALESLDEIVEVFKREGTKMVFITAGMGGGTGTGAAPVIAKAAKEMDILTVAIVTLPFRTEGPKRMKHAQEGIEELRQYVDSLLLINNENIQEIYGKLTLSEAFGKADDILATAAKSIAEVITRESTVNVDFADVKTVMKDSGIALMGSGRASGENRAMEVANAALSSPLLNHNDITGARNILINITSGEEEITLEETYQITEYIQNCAGNAADIIWGAGTDETLGADIEVTIIATGFEDAVTKAFDQPTYSPLQAYRDRQQKERETQNEAENGSSEAAESTDTASGVAEPTAQPVEAPTNAAQQTMRNQSPLTPRQRWTPPTEQAPTPEVYPLQESRRFNRPVAPNRLPDRENTPAANQHTSPLSRPAAALHVIEARPKEVATDTDNWENEPAYLRRNMKFVKDSVTEGSRPSRVVLKDEGPQSNDPSNGSLFD